MATSKTITVFTGYVDEDPLIQDLRSLRQSLGRLRAIFGARGIRLRTRKCDEDDDEALRDAVGHSDVLLFLFRTDLPALARKEFDLAYARLREASADSLPSIMVWFRDPQANELDEDLETFQGELDLDMGHFFNRYAQVDTILFQLLLHLERQGAGVPFACVGTTLVDARGEVVVDFKDTPAYSGNEVLQRAHARLEALRARQEELLDLEADDELDDEQAAELDELAKQISRAVDEEHAQQERFLRDMREYARELAEDRRMSPRRRKAIDLITQGRIREGYELLDATQIERDMHEDEVRSRTAVAEAQSQRAKVYDGVRQLLLRTRILESLVEESGEAKDAEIRRTYAIAIDYEGRNGFEPLASVGYARYLVGIAVFDKAIDLLDASCGWYRSQLEPGGMLGRHATTTIPVDDPLLPQEPNLRRGLVGALGLLVHAYQGVRNDASAAYAISERMDLLADLHAAGDPSLDDTTYGRELVDAAKAIRGSGRIDDALEWLEEACDVLSAAAESQRTPETLSLWADALQARLDVLLEQDKASEADAASRALVEVLRRSRDLFGGKLVDTRLVRTLFDLAHRYVSLGREDDVRRLAGEALGIRREAYEGSPSTGTAIALSAAYLSATIIAAELRASDDYVSCCVRRVEAIVDEYRREPTVDLQCALSETLDDLCERWETRPTRAMAKALLPLLDEAMRALEGQVAPDENSFEVGVFVGDAIAWSHEMALRAGIATDEVTLALTGRLSRLRRAASEVRNMGVYSGALQRLGERLAGAGRPAEGYGLVAERLCMLRIADGSRRDGADDPDLDRLLDGALRYASQDARRHGRDAEGAAMLAERLPILRRESDSGTRGSTFRLNGALLELSEVSLAKGDLATMRDALAEAWDDACSLFDGHPSDKTLDNLLYMSRRVAGRYREASEDGRANDILQATGDRAMGYAASCEDRATLGRLAHVLWMHMVDFRQHDDAERASQAYGCHLELCQRLAVANSADYLSYLYRFLNRMVDGEPDEPARRRAIEAHVAVAQDAYKAGAGEGETAVDELRTFSSVLELAVLAAFEKHCDDLATSYADRCVELYQRAYDAVRGQSGTGRAGLALEDAASLLSKEEGRLAKTLRENGHADEADELAGRSRGVLRQACELDPGSRISFVYSSQLFGEAQRLMDAGRVDEALALQEESVQVIDRYRRADPTERNLTWYTHVLSELADALRQHGRPEDADETESRMLETLDEGYERTGSRSLLRAYLGSIAAMARRLAEEGDSVRPLELYRRCARLAGDSFDRHHDVEGARLYSQSLTQLHYQLVKVGERDEAGDITSRQVEVTRFLFEQHPTRKVAGTLERVLRGEASRLRYLGKRLERRDYTARSKELYAERIQVLWWLAQRDTRVARELADLLKDEVATTDPTDPWILKTMHTLKDGIDYKYPPALGVERTELCLKALWLLWRESPADELMDELCDVMGVYVKFLRKRQRHPNGVWESQEEWEARQQRAIDRMYELVPMLEESRAACPDERHTYRLTYYLKDAGVMLVDAGRLDDALGMLRRRTQLLREQRESEPDLTSVTKYSHALRDEAKLCERMGNPGTAQLLEGQRESLLAEAYDSLGTDDRARRRLLDGWRACLDHRDQLYAAQGADALARRIAVLERLARVVETQVALRGTDVAPTRGSVEALSSCMGRLAECQEGLGQLEAAEQSCTAAIELLRDLSRHAEEPDGSKEKQDARELARLLSLRATIACSRLEERSADDSGDATPLEDRALMALDEALAALDAPDGPDTGDTADDSTKLANKARLHAKRCQLRRGRDDLAGAVEDGRAAVHLLEEVGEDKVDPFEIAQAYQQLGVILGEQGSAEEAETLRARKTDFLRGAYRRSPSPELASYLAYDLRGRADASTREGDLSSSTAFAAECIEMLCASRPQDAKGRGFWKATFKRAMRTLLKVPESVDAPIVRETQARATLLSVARTLDHAAETDGSDAAANARLDVLERICLMEVEDVEADETARLEATSSYATSALRYGRQCILGPGAARRHLESAARLFAERGCSLDAGLCWQGLTDVLQRAWRRKGDQASAQELYQAYPEAIEACSDPGDRLSLLKGYRDHVVEMGRAGFLGEVSPRVRELTEDIVACAEEAGLPFASVEAHLDLVEDAYANMGAQDDLLDSLSLAIDTHLAAAAEILRGLGASEEAIWLEREAANAKQHLGKPSIAWWRLGYASPDMPWQRDGRLWQAQQRLLRSSHLLRLSLLLGDWDEQKYERRNLRNLTRMRMRAYQRLKDTQDHEQRRKRLAALRWCLHNASNTLYRGRNTDERLLDESVVLRCETVQALAELAALQVGTPSAKRALGEYRDELGKLSRTLEGPAYDAPAFRDVRAWAQDRMQTASEDVGRIASDNARRA